MEIIIMNLTNVHIDILYVPENMLNGSVEKFLEEHGYSLNNISWMEVNANYVPVQFRYYGTRLSDGEETYATSNVRLKDYSIYDSVQEVKRREQEELATALRQYGEKVDGGYEWHFEGECPIVAAYCWDEPCDVVILAAKVDEDGYITIIGDEKNDRGNEHEIDVDEIFAGHIDYITSAILQQEC